MRLASLVVALALATSCDDQRSRCERAGGGWVVVECHPEWIESCVDVPVGDGVIVHLCHPEIERRCSHRCTVAESEVP